MISPPSIAPGEDGREVGTHFVFRGNKHVFLFPLSDDTDVTIRDINNFKNPATDAIYTHKGLKKNDIFTSASHARKSPRGDRNIVTWKGRSPISLAYSFIEIKTSRPVVMMATGFSGGFTLDFAPLVPTGALSARRRCTT